MAFPAGLLLVLVFELGLVLVDILCYDVSKVVFNYSGLSGELDCCCCIVCLFVPVLFLN